MQCISGIWTGSIAATLAMAKQWSWLELDGDVLKYLLQNIFRNLLKQDSPRTYFCTVLFFLATIALQCA